MKVTKNFEAYKLPDRPLKTEHTAKRIKKGGRQHLIVKSETLKRDMKISSMFYFELYQTLLWRV